MAKQSLAAHSGALSEKFSLPSIFQAPQEDIKSRYIAPYITFAHQNKSDEWTKLLSKAPDVQEGDMFLIRQGDSTKLAPAQLSWICGRQYWCIKNAAGQVQEASFQERPHPFKEQIEAVVLCYLPDTVVPANIQFRTTKCPAAKVLSDTLVEAGQPGWAEKSPAHKETLVMQYPFCRFVGTVTLGPRRTSNTSGLPYRTTSCDIRPTSLPEWRLLRAFSDSEECQRMLDDAAARFESQIAEIQSKCR